MDWKDLTPRQKFEEALACLAFLVIVLVMVFMPDLTRP
jgi:hypothetical protein